MIISKCDELPEDTKTDWKRVDAMTKKELEDNARSDPNAILADDDFWKSAKVVMPSNIKK